MRVLVDLKIDKGHLTESMITRILQNELSKKKYKLEGLRVWSSVEIHPRDPLHHAIEYVRSVEQEIEDARDRCRCECRE